MGRPVGVPPCPYDKTGRTCRCPKAYSRCAGWVRYDEERGDYTQGHGGWGWRDNEKAMAALEAAGLIRRHGPHHYSPVKS